MQTYIPSIGLIINNQGFVVLYLKLQNDFFFFTNFLIYLESTTASTFEIFTSNPSLNWFSIWNIVQTFSINMGTSIYRDQTAYFFLVLSLFLRILSILICLSWRKVTLELVWVLIPDSILSRRDLWWSMAPISAPKGKRVWEKAKREEDMWNKRINWVIVWIQVFDISIDVFSVHEEQIQELIT